MLSKYFSKNIFSYKFLFFMAVLFNLQTAFSQDTIRYYQDGKLVVELYQGEQDALPKSAFLPRVSFGFQTLTPAVYPVRLLASRFWSVGGQYRRLLVRKQNISLGIGAELAWNNLRWQNDNFIQKNQDSVLFVNPNVEQVYKNKLALLSVSVPLILYKTFEKNWRIGLGTYADWRLQSYSRTAYQLNNEKTDTKNFSDFHLQTLRFGLQAEVKYKFIKIFSKYDFSTLFKTGKAQKINLLTFGVGF